MHDRVHLVATSEAQRRANPSVRYAATVPNGLDRYPLSETKENFLLFVGRTRWTTG